MKTIFSIIIWIFGAILGLVGTVLTFFVAGIFIHNIPILCLLSLLVGFLIIFGVGKLSQYIKSKKTNNKAPIIVASSVLIVFVFLNAITVFKPLSGPIMKSELPANTMYWDLETGSHIAYWHYEAKGSKKPSPILFLHGGPGAFTREMEKEFFSQFTDLGYDVYLYDQPGAGFSSNLPLEDYTLDRYIKDIEEIRKEIGADKLILVGQSYGGVLGSTYASKYPENIEKLIFTSPGGISKLDPNEIVDIAPNASDSIGNYETTLPETARITVALLLSKISLPTAENFASQTELTDFSTKMIYGFIAQSYPPDYADKVPKLKTGGINLYANSLLLSDYENIADKVVTDLSNVKVPVLILRTEFDYIPWPNTRAYREIYSNSHLIYIKDSGHIPWAVNTQDSYEAIESFITDKSLRFPDYTGNNDPSANQ